MNEINSAINAVYDKISANTKTQISHILTAVNKILATDIIAQKNLPCFDNSALDGYAFNYKFKDEPLEILETIMAGDTATYELIGAKAYKIMTGAVMPKGADTIVRLEDAKFDGDRLIVPQDTKHTNAVRYLGEEVKCGEILLQKGEILTPAGIMLLASQGINEVEIYSDLKIAVFSSGDEIVEPWEKAGERQIYNANSSAIIAQLSASNIASEYKGIIKDDLNSIQNAIKEHEDYDVIITSGGASVGEADFMQEALKNLGYECIYSYIKVKPGKPSKCFIKNNSLIFVLPGNPMAAYLISFLTILPIIKRLSGQNSPNHTTFKVKFNGTLKLKPGRANIVLGSYADGKFSTINGNKFGSGMISPLVLANSLYIADVSKDVLNDNEEIEILRLY